MTFRVRIAPLAQRGIVRVGRRTQYWIIYRVDEGAKIVDVLRFWNTARDPEELEL